MKNVHQLHETIRALRRTKNALSSVLQCDSYSEFLKLKGNISKVATCLRRAQKAIENTSDEKESSRIRTNALFFHDLIRLKNWIDGSSVTFSTGNKAFLNLNLDIF